MSAIKIELYRSLISSDFPVSGIAHQHLTYRALHSIHSDINYLHGKSAESTPAEMKALV